MTRLGRTCMTLAAFALLVPLTALADKPKSNPPRNPPPAQTIVQQPTGLPQGDVQVVVVDEAQARDWELQIELDLMADPVTFHYALKCLAGQDGMEVRGYVPNAIVRDRALSIARKACPMEVVSGLVIQPNILMGTPGTLSLETVQARLAKQNSGGVSVIEAQLGSDGQVILGGHCSSLEEKVRFSRCLRTLAGCSSVKNDMLAPPSTMVTPVISAPVPPASAPATPTVVQAPSEPTPPATAPAARKAKVTAPWSPTPPSETKVAKSDAANSAASPSKASKTAEHGTAPWSPAPPASRAMGSGSQQADSKSSDSSNPLLPPNKRAKTSAELAQMPPAPVAPYRPSDGRPDASDVPVPAVDKEEKSEKVVQAVQNASAAPAGAPPKSRPAYPDKKAIPAGLSARNHQALKERLRASLGAAMRDVEFKFDGKGGVKVIVVVAGKNQDYDRIAQAVMQAPELKDFEVSIELRVDQ
jgi:hypothetical protein